MAHIIDLKNRQAELKPENGEELDLESTPRHFGQSQGGGGQAKVISWSGQLHYHSNVKAAVATAITLFAIAALVQIFQKNIITTVFFALLGGVLLMNAGRKPKEIEFEINPVGVVVGEILHRYGEISSFWIEYDPALDIKELSIQLKKWYMPYIKMPLAEQNPVRLRLALLEFLPEIEHKDTLVEILARRLGI